MVLKEINRGEYMKLGGKKNSDLVRKQVGISFKYYIKVKL